MAVAKAKTTKTTKEAPKKEAPKSAKTTADKAKKDVKTAPSGSKYNYANGKRKTSVARVKLFENGTGVITINDKPIADFCSVKVHVEVIKSPLKLIGKTKDFDVQIQVIGGGVTGQAEAARHGIAKALVDLNPEFRATLKRAGMLTRDARVKERKKYGLKRARRAPQWAKR